MRKTMLICLLLLASSAHAQQTLFGLVSDPSGTPLDAATVSLAIDTPVLASAATDSGRFTLPYAAAGRYHLRVFASGYRAYEREIVLPEDTVRITLQPESQVLGEVVVRSAKPVVEQRADRTIFHVENSLVASGATAWDALARAPGVRAQQDNSLSVHQKGVAVYIDGRPLRLSGDDLAAYLRGLPSDQLSKIEVFSNPPAKFDAQGGAVVNIVLKKQRQNGFHGTATGSFTQATHSSGAGSTSFNYRQGTLNLYGNYGYSQRNYRRDHRSYVHFAGAGGDSYWNAHAVSDRNGESHNYRVGADLQLSKNQILGVLVSGNEATGSAASSSPTRITSGPQNALDSLLRTADARRSGSGQYSFNANYNLKLDTAGQSLNIDLDISPFHSDRDQLVSSTSYGADGSLRSGNYRIRTPAAQRVGIYSGALDYTCRIGRRWEFSSGLKFSRVASRSSLDFYDVAAASPQLLPQNSNHFRYSETIAAVYTSLNRKFGALELQGGLRGELTSMDGYSQTLDSSIRQRYFKLFPTLYALYQLNDRHSLNVNYSYRIERPDYDLLNPGKNYSSPYTYSTGNPALRPWFVHSLELGYSYKNQYNVTAYYNLTQNQFVDLTGQDNGRKLFYTTYANVGTSSAAGVQLSMTLRPFGWWETSNFVEGTHTRVRSTDPDNGYDLQKFSYSLTSTQTFLLNRKLGLKAELSGFYYSPSIAGLYQRSRIRSLDAGLGINVLGGKGSLRVAVRDLLYTDVFVARVNYKGQDNGFVQHNDTRSGTISFSYRFGKNIAASRQRTTSDEQEKQRTQQH